VKVGSSIIWIAADSEKRGQCVFESGNSVPSDYHIDHITPGALEWLSSVPRARSLGLARVIQNSSTSVLQSTNQIVVLPHHTASALH
jgi:hypothetical protein